MAFTFQTDSQSRAGAVRATSDGNNFYVPVVIFGADGVTNISSTNPLSVQVSSRPTQHSRVLVNSAIAGNGSVDSTINCLLGAKSFNIAMSTAANAQIAVYGCDVNGNPLNNNSYIAASASGVTNATLLIPDYGGAPYIAIYVTDKSGSPNTVNFVDVWWTNS